MPIPKMKYKNEKNTIKCIEEEENDNENIKALQVVSEILKNSNIVEPNNKNVQQTYTLTVNG